MRDQEILPFPQHQIVGWFLKAVTKKLSCLSTAVTFFDFSLQCELNLRIDTGQRETAYLYRLIVDTELTLGCFKPAPSSVLQPEEVGPGGGGIVIQVVSGTDRDSEVVY